MKTKRRNTTKNRAYINALPKIYVLEQTLAGMWVVKEYPFEGTFKRKSNPVTGLPRYVPMVWRYVDVYGEVDEWILQDVESSTSLMVYDWSQREKGLKIIADRFNKNL